MTMSVSFRCKCCGEVVTLPLTYGDEIAGFERSAKWLSAAPASNGAAAPLLGRAPGAGERHWLSVRFPFAADSDEPFWSLFRPPMAHVNGWEDQPQDIPDSAVVECRLYEVLEVGPEHATIRVEVLRSIPISAIGDELPVTEASRSRLEIFDGSRTCASRWGRFSHFSYSLEGDAGSWALVERRGGGDFLILQGDWSWHREWFSASNLRLSPADAAVLARPSDR